jgi:hypothetical protein
MANEHKDTPQADAAPSDRKLEPWLYVEEVKQLCRDYSSRNGNVYIKDVESSLDGLANQPLRDTYNGGAIQVLAAIINAKDSGQDASLILDENSPLVDAARAAIAGGGAQEAVAWGVMNKNGYAKFVTNDEEEAKGWKDAYPSTVPLYAAPLPREAATVMLTDEQWIDIYKFAHRHGVMGVMEKARALLAASNGEKNDR